MTHDNAPQALRSVKVIQGSPKPHSGQDHHAIMHGQVRVGNIKIDVGVAGGMVGFLGYGKGVEDGKGSRQTGHVAP